MKISNSKKSTNVALTKRPTVKQINAEITRRRINSTRAMLWRTAITIVVFITSVSVLAAIYIIPVLKVSGSGMKPILRDGDIIVAVKNLSLVEKGDIIAFYYNDKILLKRVIGLPGDKIDIDEDGNVFVNDRYIDEPYVDEKALGICNIKLPAVVPESSMFVLGDHREASVDSRSSDVGMVYEERIIGKVVFRVFPFSKIGKV